MLSLLLRVIVYVLCASMCGVVCVIYFVCVARVRLCVCVLVSIVFVLLRRCCMRLFVYLLRVLLCCWSLCYYAFSFCVLCNPVHVLGKCALCLRVRCDRLCAMRLDLLFVCGFMLSSLVFATVWLFLCLCFMRVGVPLWCVCYVIGCPR